MALLRLRPAAVGDLKDIWNFIADDSPARADAYLRRLNEALSRLAEAPLIGRLRPEIKENTRSFPVDSYVVLYLALPDGIDVVRVVHGSRDLARLF